MRQPHRAARHTAGACAWPSGLSTDGAAGKVAISTQLPSGLDASSKPTLGSWHSCLSARVHAIWAPAWRGVPTRGHQLRSTHLVLALGSWLGATLVEFEGVTVVVAVRVGVPVGVRVGLLVGISLGVPPGVCVGVPEGEPVGVPVGVRVGLLVGVSLGVRLGLCVGVVLALGFGMQSDADVDPIPAVVSTGAHASRTVLPAPAAYSPMPHTAHTPQ